MAALDSFVNQEVKVYISSRNIALVGTLISHDEEALVLEDDSGSTLVFKDQVISIVQALPVD
jgi:sRNA-binding regulator protein Hfq